MADIDHMVGQYTAMRVADIHPAVQSGPSSSPQLTLMGIPAEIRACIYSQVLCKDSDVFISFNLLKKTDKRYGRGYGYPKKGLAHGLAIGPKHTTALLRTCRQVHDEALQALYGHNIFCTYNVRGFAGSFVNHLKFGIGKARAALIKRVVFGVPEPVKNDPQKHLGEFLDFVCDDLVGLESMTLRVRFHTCMPDPGVWHDTDWPQERRGILNTAAWTTKRHPTLKKAVWLAESGGQYDLDLDEFDDWMVEFEIKLTRPMTSKTVNKSVRAIIVGLQEETKDIVLDCPSIRSTGWEDLANHCDWIYALSDDAVTSEPLSKKEKESMMNRGKLGMDPGLSKLSAVEAERMVKFTSDKKKLQGSKERAAAIRNMSSWR